MAISLNFQLLSLDGSARTYEGDCHVGLRPPRNDIYFLTEPLFPIFLEKSGLLPTIYGILHSATKDTVKKEVFSPPQRFCYRIVS